MLAFNLIRRAIEYAEQLVPGGSSVSFGMITNGSLLDVNELGFFADHDFDLMISFDGVGNAQNYRPEIPFGQIDAILSTANKLGQGLLPRISIAMTIHPGNVHHLGDSYRYLLDMNVKRLYIEGDVSKRTNTSEYFLAELEQQFCHVQEHSIGCLSRGEPIPILGHSIGNVPGFAGNADLDPEQYRCHLSTPQWKVVDVNGDLYSCIFLVDGLVRTSRGGPLPDSLKGLGIGNLHKPQNILVPREYLSLARRRLGTRFLGNPERCGLYGNCRECKYAKYCFVCPLFVVIDPDYEILAKVPDHLCQLRWLLGRFRETISRHVGHLYDNEQKGGEEHV